MSHQLRGFFKRITGDNVSYDALTKQPITDAELKLKLFNDATSTSITGIEAYIKSITKLIDAQLGEKFNECKELFSKYDRPNDQIMGTVFGRISDIQKELSAEVSELIRNIEFNVLKPLVDYQKELITVKDNKKELKDAYDKIEQCRQNLDKSKRDLDNSQKPVSQSHRMTMMREFESKRFNELTKLEEKLIKCEKELDEATSVANEKYDKYTESLYKRISDECELSIYYLNYLKAQHTYHRRALDKLNNLIPSVENSIKNYHKKPVFHQPLDEYVNRSLRTNKNGQHEQLLVSPVIKKLIEGMCKQNVFSEEGIFRIAGSRVKMNCVVYAINSGYLEYLDTANDFDVHCLAGVLKQYIRELPDSILCNHLYDEWIKAIKSPNKLEAFELVLDKLPKVNYDNLCYLIKFLAKIVENSDQTKMTNSNMGICFGVSLLSNNNPINNSNNNNSSSTNLASLNASTLTSDYNQSGKSIDMATATNVFDFLLTNHAQLFPDDINFSTTNLTSKPSISQRNNPLLNGYSTQSNKNSSAIAASVNLNEANFQPPVIQRRTITNANDLNTTNEHQRSGSDSTSDQSSPTIKSFQLKNSPSPSSISSSNSNNLNISNLNRHVKKSSYDSREDEKYSSNNSLNSISNKSIHATNQHDNSIPSSPKQKSKKQAPAPPPSNTNSKLNDSQTDPSTLPTVNVIMSSAPLIEDTSSSSSSNNSIYPKLQPRANEVTVTPTTTSTIIITPSTTTHHTTSSRILEKPNQPPPSVPNRPPPIGFNISLGGSDLPQVDLSYQAAATSSCLNNSALLSTSSLSTHSSVSTSSASSSSSSQEMLNTPSLTNTNNNLLPNKAPKPAVPRRPGGLIASQINKITRNPNDIDLNENDDDHVQSVKTSSEITSL